MGSDQPGAVVIGGLLSTSDEVVGTCAVAPEEPPGALGELVADRPAWRLRSMATAPRLRSRGIGAAVLRAALAHVKESGGALVWCNARTAARRFYEGAGFVAFGSEWDEGAIGPHIVMWRRTDESKGNRDERRAKGS